MNDFLEQISFVADSVERIVWQIDRDNVSPTYGCQHLDYWRDKTSDVADTRRQEVMLPLSLLYMRDYPCSKWNGQEKLKRVVLALMDFWAKSQYPDGSFDEWYKGERAFAAAAFSTHALARTLYVLNGQMPPMLDIVYREKLNISARWLCNRDDLFKTNHQAVGAAALAWAGEVLDKQEYKIHAKKKIDSIIKNQTQEGWFPEIGKMDPGYTFLTVEFVMIAMDILDDWSNVDPFIIAFNFACATVAPDLTVQSETGICRNPYLSRIATVLMAEYSEFASRLLERFLNESPGFKSYSNILGDDLRLVRWAFQPLLAYDYYKDRINHEIKKPSPLPYEVSEHRITYYPAAEFLQFTIDKGSGLFIFSSGGYFCIYSRTAGPGLIDQGYAIKIENGYAVNMASDMTKYLSGNEYVVDVPIVRVRKFMPPFWARVILRMACSTAFGSHSTRKMIDMIRKYKGTPVNQASSNISNTDIYGRLIRKIIISPLEIILKDRIILYRDVSAGNIYSIYSRQNDWPYKDPLESLFNNVPENFSEIEIIKKYTIDEFGSILTIPLSVTFNDKK